MFLRKANSKWIVRTPAKLNVYLSLRGRRADGYHEIETFMVPIGLFDTLVFAPLRSTGGAAADVRFRLASAELQVSPLEVPRDETNLVVRAIDELRHRTGCDAGAEVTLIKRIPAGAGLGGGSSDAAAALAAANAAWGLDLPRNELAAVAATLGSDVPFFLTGQAAICRGRGEVVTPVAHRTRLHAVLVTPRQRLTSRDVYAAVRETDFAPRDSSRFVPRERLVSAFHGGDVGTVGRLLFNALERAALSLEPGLSRLKELMASIGGSRAVLTGSGSSFFCLCRTARHARRGAAWLNSRGFSSAMAVGTCG